MDITAKHRTKIEVIIIGIIFGMLIQGCKKDKNIPEGDTFNHYQKETVDFDSIKGSGYLGIYGNSDGLFLAEFEITNNEKEKIQFYQVEVESMTATPVQIAQEYYYHNKQIGAFKDGEGYSYLFDRPGRIFKYNEKMELQEEILPALKCDVDEEDWNDIDIRSDEEYIYIHNQSNNAGNVYVFDRQWIFKDRICNINAVFSNPKGVKFLCDGEVFDYNPQEKKLQKNTNETLAEDERELLCKSRIVNGDIQYDYYFYPTLFSEEEKTDASINCLYGVKNGMAEKVMNFRDFQLDFEMIWMQSDGKGGFIVMETHNLAEGGNLFYRLYPSDKKVTDDRETITIAGIETTEELNKIIIDFNKKDTKYKVEYRDYAKENIDESIRDLQVDMVKGQEIDIVMLNGIDYRILGEGNALSDLSDYFEKSTVVTKEDFISQTIQCSENNAIFSIYPEFSLAGFIARKNEDISDWERYAGEDNKIPLFDSSDPVKITNQILQFSGDVYINEQEKEISFGEDFTELMECLKNEKNKAEGITTLLPGKDIRFGYEQMDFPYDYIALRRMVGERCNCTNMKFSGAVIIPGKNEFAIPQNAKNKIAAYTFLDFLFSEDNYYKYFGKVHFPALNREWEKTIEKMKTREKPISYGYNEFSIQIGAIDETEEEELRSLVLTAKYIRPMKGKYQVIVEEEMDGYFEGDKNLSEVMEQMTQRLQIAINE